MAFKRNFAFRLAAEVLNKVLAMAVTLVLARKLGPEGWGGLQWALAGAGLFGVLADFGLGSLTTRELALAPEKERRAWLLAAWRLKALLWLGALLLFAAYQATAGASKASLLLPAALLTVALSLGEFSSALYAGFERLDLDLRFGSLSKLAQALAALAALAVGWDAQGVLLAMAAAAWGGWVLNAWTLLRLSVGDKRGPSVGPKMLVLLQGLWPFGLVSVLTLVYVKADNLLLERLAGLSAVGIYQSAYKWFEAVAFVPTAFIAAAFPGLARAEKERDGAAKRQRAYAAMVGLGAVMTVFLFALAPLLPRLLGPAYAGAPPLLQALAAGCLLLFPNYILITMLVATRRQARVLLGVVLAVVVNLGGNLALMPRFGALGASWMTVLTEGAIFLAALASLRAALSLSKVLTGMLQAVVAALLSCAVALGLATWWPTGGAWSSLLVAPTVCLGLVILAGLLPWEEISLVVERLFKGKKAA